MRKTWIPGSNWSVSWEWLDNGVPIPRTKSVAPCVNPSKFRVKYQSLGSGPSSCFHCSKSFERRKLKRGNHPNHHKPSKNIQPSPHAPLQWPRDNAACIATVELAALVASSLWPVQLEGSSSETHRQNESCILYIINIYLYIQIIRTDGWYAM